jgi:ubiquinone/menaquinone biosynthesis C-methylase UbiE
MVPRAGDERSRRLGILAPMNDAGSAPVHPGPPVVLPPYDAGWLVDGNRLSFFSTVDADPSVNWSAELESLHEEASRSHFLDQWTRQALLAAIGQTPPDGTIVDLGCSTGYLLEDLERAHPGATLIGVDLVAAGLVKAHAAVPAARLLQSDVCELPLADASADAIVSANLLEHVPDDVQALREVARVLRPGGRAALIVPAGPSTYDYYDRFLGHERRYGRGELASKCREAGLEPITDRHIAALLYPVFWFVKQRNRRQLGHLQGEALEARVSADIARTHDSRIGRGLWRIEEVMAARGVLPPFGVRSMVTARR